MKKLLLTFAACLALANVAQAQQIYGDYVETRSADVYTGACFAMSEVNLVGDQAILAWRVAKGEWNGVKLDGLSVVGVAKASATLGDTTADPYPAKAIIIVDEKATAEQRTALQAFAQAMAGRLFEHVVRTDVAPISIAVQYEGEHPTSARVQAGFAAIQTRPITNGDKICGHEHTYYPTLTKTLHAMPEVAVLDQFKGEGLGVEWTLRGKRSAFVGNFAR